MLTLYAIPHSLYCAKVRIGLRHKRVVWQELPPPGGVGSEGYRRIVPSGNLPALVDSDLVIGDSEAILEYLAEALPGPDLLPGDVRVRARMRDRARFHDTRLEPDLRKLFPHVAAARDPAHRDAEAVARAAAALSLRLAQLGRMIAAAGDLPFSLGDCGLPVTFAWVDALAPVLDAEITWPGAVTEYRARLAQVPAVAEELAAYAPAVAEWVAARTGG